MAARELVALRSRVGVAVDDGDFLTCVTIDSETDELPVGAVRQYWATGGSAEKTKRSLKPKDGQ
jgi:hypothetical protein